MSGRYNALANMKNKVGSRTFDCRLLNIKQKEKVEMKKQIRDIVIFFIMLVSTLVIVSIVPRGAKCEENTSEWVDSEGRQYRTVDDSLMAQANTGVSVPAPVYNTEVRSSLGEIMRVSGLPCATNGYPRHPETTEHVEVMLWTSDGQQWEAVWKERGSK